MTSVAQLGGNRELDGVKRITALTWSAAQLLAVGC
jgi:hypothetical protein